MDRSFLEQVRSFNRAVTLRTGALNESYLGRGRPLGQARLLFEIGPVGSDIRSLRERLGLDSGYVSRLLKSLENEGLVAVESDSNDRRRRLVTLTAKGRAEHVAYDRLSDDLARSMLAALSASQRDRLVAAMAEVETLMTPPPSQSASSLKTAAMRSNVLRPTTRNSTSVSRTVSIPAMAVMQASRFQLKLPAAF